MATESTEKWQGMHNMKSYNCGIVGNRYTSSSFHFAVKHLRHSFLSLCSLCPLWLIPLRPKVGSILELLRPRQQRVDRRQPLALGLLGERGSCFGERVGRHYERGRIAQPQFDGRDGVQCRREQRLIYQFLDLMQPPFHAGGSLGAGHAKGG